MDSNLKAFLTLIRTGEGTLGDNGYRTLYGGKLFDSFDDHPRIKVKAGNWISSAAGAYQFLEKTWDGLVKANPWELTDFSPDKQDAGAVYLIKGRKAYDDVIAGRFKAAILKCNKEWASLPLSPYGQPTLTMDKALLILANAGGTLAAEPEPTTATPEKPMAPFLLAAVSPMIQALPDFAKIFQSPDVASRNVEAVTKAAGIVMNAVDATNVQEAVEKIQASPAVAAVANDAIRMSQADLMDMIERMARIDEASVGAAREFSRNDKPVMGQWLFVHVLSVLFVALGGGAAIFVLATSTDPTERVMALQTLLIVGFASVAGFWLGSSRSSQMKDLVK